MQEERSPTGKTRHRDERDLRLVVELTTAPGCPLREVQGDILDVQIHRHETGCHCDFRLASESTGPEHVEHQSVTIEDPSKRSCACEVFSEYGCVPHLKDTREGSTVVATYVADRDVAWNLLESLGEVCDAVRLVRVTNDDFGGMGKTVELDLSVLSEKQQHALRQAAAAGYYGTERNVSLTEIAADMGISASALSQRLKRAEDHLLSQLYE